MAHQIDKSVRVRITLWMSAFSLIGLVFLAVYIPVWEILIGALFPLGSLIWALTNRFGGTKNGQV